MGLPMIPSPMNPIFTWILPLDPARPDAFSSARTVRSMASAVSPKCASRSVVVSRGQPEAVLDADHFHRRVALQPQRLEHGRAQAADDGVLLRRHDRLHAPRLLHDGFAIDGLDRADVHDRGGDARLLQAFGRLEGPRHHDPACEDDRIAALAQHHGGTDAVGRSAGVTKGRSLRLMRT